jgi:GTP-binding protein
VINKADKFTDDDGRKAAVEDIVSRLDWKQPWFVISAISREGTWDVCMQVQQFFDAERAAMRADDEASDDVRMRGGEDSAK